MVGVEDDSARAEAGTILHQPRMHQRPRHDGIKKSREREDGECRAPGRVTEVRARDERIARGDGEIVRARAASHELVNGCQRFRGLAMAHAGEPRVKFQQHLEAWPRQPALKEAEQMHAPDDGMPHEASGEDDAQRLESGVRPLQHAPCDLRAEGFGENPAARDAV